MCRRRESSYVGLVWHIRRGEGSFTRAQGCCWLDHMERPAPRRRFPDLADAGHPNTPKDVQKLGRKLLKRAPGPIESAHEAGPCGFVLQRQLEAMDERIACAVIAPSLIPRKPGERVKTDRRDARKLCELLQAGLLTEVHAPTEAQETVRDLCRCREAAKTDLHRAHHRLGKLLLRRGYRSTQGRAWTQRHRVWLRSLKFDDPVEQFVFDDYLLAIEQLEARIQNIELRMQEVSRRWAKVALTSAHPTCHCPAAAAPHTVQGTGLIRTPGRAFFISYGKSMRR